eukprot:1037043-Prorocentrum_minimum.AAC.1
MKATGISPSTRALYPAKAIYSPQLGASGVDGYAGCGRVCVCCDIGRLVGADGVGEGGGLVGFGGWSGTPLTRCQLALPWARSGTP